MHKLRVSVAELLGRPGMYRDIKLSEPLEGARTALARLTEAPIKADLRAQSVIEGILITGRVRGGTVLQCARCLAEFRSEVQVDLCELFVAPGHEYAGPDDAYRVVGTEIDLEEMLRDAVTLALPLNPLCRAECKGYCATCGADLNAGPCGCAAQEVDPRWAPLDALKERLEQQ